jgi:hypothetical protein
MALRLPYVTPVGVEADYWRIFALNLAKTGAGGPVGIAAQIGLYHSAEASNNGRGALMTQSLSLPTLGVMPIDEAVTDEQATEALGVLLAWVYTKVKAGEHDRPEGEDNTFAAAVDA